uniref:Uncharacterized protein n=1 Tax=Arion vulgaris TaxID=1028688 RepID=A0A0B6ZWA0_9EUPU
MMRAAIIILLMLVMSVAVNAARKDKTKTSTGGNKARTNPPSRGSPKGGSAVHGNHRHPKLSNGTNADVNSDTNTADLE